MSVHGFALCAPVIMLSAWDRPLTDARIAVLVVIMTAWVLLEAMAQPGRRSAPADVAGPRWLPCLSRKRHPQRSCVAWRDPDRAQGREVTIAELLDAAAAKIGGRFAEQPSAESQLRQTIGGVYLAVGRYAEADRHLQRALELRRDLYGEDSLQAAESTLLEASRILDSISEADPRLSLGFIRSLAELYDAWGKPLKAAEWRAKLPTEQDVVASDRPVYEKQEE